MDPASLRPRIEAFLQGNWEGTKRIHGLQGGARAYLLSLAIAAESRPIIVVAPTQREAEDLFSDLAFFLGENKRSLPFEKRLYLFPAWDILPFEKLSPHPDTLAARLEGLYALVEGKAPVWVSTPAALMQKVIPKEAFKNSYVYLVEGQDVARESLLEHLVHWGFQNVPLVEERGDFSGRGGIIDLFPPGYPRPFRLEFDGDRLESIREFDAATQRSTNHHQEILLLPMKEFSLKRAEVKQAVKRIDQRARELEIQRRERNLILDSLKDGIPFPGVEFLLPYFYRALSPVFSYLPAGAILWLDGAAQVEAEAERYGRLTWERSAKVQEEGRLAPPAEELYLGETEWRNTLASFRQVQCESLEVMAPAGSSEGSFLSVRSFLNSEIHHEISTLHRNEPSLSPLVGHLREWKDQRVFFVAPSLADANRFQDLLRHYEFEVPISDSPFPSVVSRDDASRAILVGELSQGFKLPEDRFVLLTLDEIFATKKRPQAIAERRHPSRFITSLSELKQDDFVVHLHHGIGMYRGLKFLSVGGVEGEFLHLEYEGGDRLYLPVDRINLVQKYIGGEGAQPALDRLGGASWERVKAKTRKSVLAMAQELVALYAVREVHGGHSFPPPDALYQEFEATFEFEETPDQQRAIEDTLRDMQKKKPMDRLICGDVGYGKTEVALRAAFLAVMNGKQVAVLAPTTVLAQQHLQTFRRRFRNYPVRVEMASRFLTAKEGRDVIADVAKGTVDIIIGTHRLLQKDVQFRDLGLLVIDEEHRFGVAHKEKLKKLRSLVDVSSLTATPIPRTLHMSLIGIRDMSIIETPPLDRLAIQTFITRYEEGVIRDAILRELQRGGQVFFLHNRVETIARMAQKVAELVPEARIAVAHGQMRPRDLEKVMVDFLENRAQVLVCSAIIESGLDFPNANTIIINRADKFGLAQLYQLRGRVGRSHRRAYAYLLIPGERVITRDAERRLRALQELDGLGVGFKLALHDLEIRGAGNLLGQQQSGHIAAIGFELYTQMMEKAVRELKGQTLAPEVEPEIRLGIPAYFPEEFIPDTNQRLLFYKRLASLEELEELESVKEELKDRYGSFTTVVENLFLVMYLRRVLKDYLVEKLTFSEGRLVLQFHSQSPVRVERLLELMAEDHGRYRLSPDGRLTYHPQQGSWETLVQETVGLLESLR